MRKLGRLFSEMMLYLPLTSRTTSQPSVKNKVNRKLLEVGFERKHRFQPGSFTVNPGINNLLDGMHIKDCQAIY